MMPCSHRSSQYTHKIFPFTTPFKIKKFHKVEICCNFKIHGNITVHNAVDKVKISQKSQIIKTLRAGKFYKIFRALVRR